MNCPHCGTHVTLMEHRRRTGVSARAWCPTCRQTRHFYAPPKRDQVAARHVDERMMEDALKRRTEDRLRAKKLPHQAGPVARRFTPEEKEEARRAQEAAQRMTTKRGLDEEIAKLPPDVRQLFE